MILSHRISLHTSTAILLALMSTTAAPVSGAETFQVHAGERQLFLDDLGIAKLEGLTRTLHQPAKKGAVIRPTFPDEAYLQTRSAPMWDAKVNRWKIWLFPSGIYAGTAYAESTDGVHWYKPNLGQVEVNGSSANNYITIDPQLTWPANLIINVVLDPHDPDPARRFKGLGHARGREPMVSADGIRWRRLDAEKIPSFDESNMSYDHKTRTFIAAVKTRGQYGRAHAITTSKDFESWSPPELFFQADELDQELGRQKIAARKKDPTLQQMVADDPKRYNADIYNVGVFRYESLYVGMPTLYYATGPSADGTNTDGFKEIQLACSRDLKKWQRLADRKPFIPPSPRQSGAYDLTGMIAPSNAVVRGDELWFYYTGSKYRRWPEHAEPDVGAVNLAVLRRDGFISLDAGEQTGTLLTAPFELPGRQLLVNVDARKGALQIELVGVDGEVAALSEPLNGDLIGESVKWSHGDLAKLKGQSVSLRATLRNAKFYSYWVE